MKAESSTIKTLILSLSVIFLYRGVGFAKGMAVFEAYQLEAVVRRWQTFALAKKNDPSRVKIPVKFIDKTVSQVIVKINQNISAEDNIGAGQALQALQIF